MQQSPILQLSALSPLLIKGKETCKAVGVWLSFDGPHILALNYSVWDTERRSSFDSHKSLALI